uniref:polysaccharide deacetylase family protein n=1 Tax=uncultured Bacteroides sp. TaxID=162156 RepID=UPI00280C2C33|nr:polysaccharide deacetylase family protein [uncultured Bacteroides sp.]
MVTRTFSCIMFHALSDSPNDKFTLSYHEFDSLIEHLNACKYIVTDINTLSEKKYPKGKFTVFTFDDGHVSNLYAAKRLHTLGMKATFFLVEEYIGMPEYLNIEQIKEIVALGHSIGIHGYDHEWWTDYSVDKLSLKLCEVKEYLTEQLGVKVISCSPPGGQINEKIIKAILNLKSFKFVRTSKPGINNENNKVMFSTGIRHGSSLDLIMRKISCDKKTYLYLRVLYHIKSILHRVYWKITFYR